MDTDVFAEILEWSTAQPAWQRDALRRLFTSGPVSSTDLDDLLEVCKAKHGLVPPKAARPLTKDHLAVKEADGSPVTLRFLTHHVGVNALAPKQTVNFGPSLTVVYGQNAAGKSGYTRILKRACRSRFAEDILGNVLADGAPLKGRATIGYAVGGKDDSADWTPESAPTGALAHVSVFDGQCAPVYLRDKTDVAFRPFSLDVFDRLAATCLELKKRLEVEQIALFKTPIDLPKVPDGTKVAVLLANLTGLTTTEEVRALATLSADESDRLRALRQKQKDVLSADPKQKARDLEQKAIRLDLLANHLNALTTGLGSNVAATLQESEKALATARKALAALRGTVFTPDLLPTTGEESWRTLWEAASAFSAAAYPNRDFPVLQNGRCVLCQQTIGPDASIRFQHFVELVTSTAQDDVRNAERAHKSKLDSVRALAPSGHETTLAEIEADDADLAHRARDFTRSALATRTALLKADYQHANLAPSPEADVRKLAKELRERVGLLQQQVPRLRPNDAEELQELESRQALHDKMQVVQSAIERSRRNSAYSQCISETNTTSVTRKGTELTKRLVTEKLRSQFKAELALLEFAHLSVEIKTAGGAKGTLFHQLVFSNAPGVTVAKVLSEGESRTLSLAAFLAELGTAPHRSGIIFDDPVSSLDHVWRERIARRLVRESALRQVIVFTHDLFFLKTLVAECESKGLQCGHQYIRRDDTTPGICSADLPWKAMPVRGRIGVLRTRWQAVEKLYRTGGVDAYESEARDIYGALRETWEQGVGEILLWNIVEPYRPDISTKKVRVLHDITPPDCDAVEVGMSECSRWMRGHHEAAGDGTPFPKPAELKQRIDDLDQWVQAIRKRRDGK